MKLLYHFETTCYDHSEQDYVIEHGKLLIKCIGHYTIDELLYKIGALRDAQQLVDSGQVTLIRNTD